MGGAAVWEAVAATGVLNRGCPAVHLGAYLAQQRPAYLLAPSTIPTPAPPAPVAFSGMISKAQVGMLYDLNNFILVAARVPQVRQRQASGLEALMQGTERGWCVHWRLKQGLPQAAPGPSALRAWPACQGSHALPALVPAQILQNFTSRSTGQLSLITYALNWAGASARIFTSIQEGAGAAMVRGSAISALLNFVVVAQILAYGNKAARAQAKAKKKD